MLSDVEIIATREKQTIAIITQCLFFIFTSKRQRTPAIHSEKIVEGAPSILCGCVQILGFPSGRPSTALTNDATRDSRDSKECIEISGSVTVIRFLRKDCKIILQDMIGRLHMILEYFQVVDRLHMIMNYFQVVDRLHMIMK